MRLSTQVIDAALAQHLDEERERFRGWVKAGKSCTCPASHFKGLPTLYKVIRSAIKSDWHLTSCPMWWRERTRPEFS